MSAKCRILILKMDIERGGVGFLFQLSKMDYEVDVILIETTPREVPVNFREGDFSLQLRDFDIEIRPDNRRAIRI